MLNIDLIQDNTASDISSALCFTANTGEDVANTALQFAVGGVSGRVAMVGDVVIVAASPH